MEIKLSSTSATSAPKKVVTFLQAVFGFNAKAATSIALTLTSLSKEKLVNTSQIDSFLSFARSSTNADIEFATGRKEFTNLAPVLISLAKAKTFEATLANVNKFKFKSPIASTKPASSVEAPATAYDSVRKYLYSIVGRYAQANGFDVSVRNVGEFLSNRGEYNESISERLMKDLGVRRLTLGEHDKVLGVDCVVVQFKSKSNAFLISDTRLPRIKYKGAGKVYVVEAKLPSRPNGEAAPDATTAQAFADVQGALRYISDKNSCSNKPDCRWG